MSRRGASLLAMIVAGLQAAPALGMDGPGASPPASRLAMPYSCSIVQGLVVVQPGPELLFDITGKQEQRLFTTCDPPFSNNCRSLNVQKFDIACGTERVSWHRVVAAIGTTTAGEATASNGHLVLVRDADAATGLAPSCKDRKGAAGECLPWSVRKPKERLVLPRGFAPVSEVGASVLDGSAPVATYAATSVASPTVQLPGSGPYRMTPDHGADDAFADIPVSGATATTVSRDFDSSDGWTTSLSFSKVEESTPEIIIATSSVSGKAVANTTTSNSMNNYIPWIGSLVAFLTLVAAYFLYRAPQIRFAGGVTDATGVALRSMRKAQDQAADLIGTLRSRLAETDSEYLSATQPTDPALASALLQLRAMFARTEAAVATLSNGTVVREVMQTELAGIRDRMDGAERAARRGSMPVMKLAAQFRQIARDIDRVQNVTQSAAQSTSRLA